MESRFGHDFSRVRVHTDQAAAESAAAMRARAYTAGEDIVFGPRQYAPTTTSGQRLIAHELAHVAQQRRGAGSDPESHARLAADTLMRGQAVSPEAVGGAAPGVYKDDEGSSQTRQQAPSFTVPWDFLLPHFHLIPPLTPPGLPALTPPLVPLQGLSPSTPSPAFQPPPAPPPTPASAPLPSRLSFFESGRFSLGGRLGLPDLPPPKPGDPPSRSAEILREGKIIDEHLSGKIPTGLDAVDKAELAKIIWSIVSTNIAPDLGRSIASKLTKTTGPGGPKLQLDAVIITSDVKGGKGGGITFTVEY